MVRLDAHGSVILLFAQKLTVENHTDDYESLQTGDTFIQTIEVEANICISSACSLFDYDLSLLVSISWVRRTDKQVKTGYMKSGSSEECTFCNVEKHCWLQQWVFWLLTTVAGQENWLQARFASPKVSYKCICRFAFFNLLGSAALNCGKVLETTAIWCTSFEITCLVSVYVIPCLMFTSRN